MAPHNPVLLVEPLEGRQLFAELLHGCEASCPEKVLLENAHKTFGATVALRWTHISRRAFDSREFELASKIVGDELGPWLWQTVSPLATSFPKPPKCSRSAWRNGSRASKTGPALGCMESHTLAGAVINQRKKYSPEPPQWSGWWSHPALSRFSRFHARLSG
jgi:hypothetical protein